MPMISDRIKSLGMRMAVVWTGLATALALSIFLAAGLCPETCKATYQWTIFGMQFPFLGVGFFALCLLLFPLRKRSFARGLLRRGNKRRQSAKNPIPKKGN